METYQEKYLAETRWSWRAIAADTVTASRLLMVVEQLDRVAALLNGIQYRLDSLGKDGLHVVLQEQARVARKAQQTRRRRAELARQRRRARA